MECFFGVEIPSLLVCGLPPPGGAVFARGLVHEGHEGMDPIQEINTRDTVLVRGLFFQPTSELVKRVVTFIR